MFGSEQNTIILSLYAILPAIIIFFYIYKRDYFPEPPRIVFITLLLGAGISFPLMILIPFFEGYLETTNFGIESNHFYMSFIRAAFLEETLKFLIVIYYCLYLNEFNEPMDALVYSVAASIGFAVYENWEYVISGSEVSLTFAKDIALIRAFSAVPLHALTGVFMGFFLIEAIFEKINKKLFLFLALFFPICLHGLYNLILSSNNFSTYWIYVLLIVFIIRAYFVFKKERNLQKIQNNRFSKTIPMHSDIIFSILISGFILFSFNYFINFVLYK